MIASAHLSVGAFSGVLVQRYLPPECGIVERVAAGFCVGVISHILTDAVPHQEYSVAGYGLGLVLLLEISAVFTLVFYPPIQIAIALVLFSAMSGAAFPDLLGMVHTYLVRWPLLDLLGGALHVFHGKMPVGFRVSFFVQTVISALAIFFVRSKLV